MPAFFGRQGCALGLFRLYAFEPMFWYKFSFRIIFEVRKLLGSLYFVFLFFLREFTVLFWGHLNRPLEAWRDAGILPPVTGAFHGWACCSQRGRRVRGWRETSCFPTPFAVKPDMKMGDTDLI